MAESPGGKLKWLRCRGLGKSVQGAVAFKANPPLTAKSLSANSVYHGSTFRLQGAQGTVVSWGGSRAGVSHPFRGEAAKWMGHPAWLQLRAARKLRAPFQPGRYLLDQAVKRGVGGW
jgi:hypothetical protein